MATHFEESFQRDVERIRSRITGMAAYGERALRDGLQALVERNRQLAYTVILRDQKIDEMEREIDRLCLEFLIRQQPVAGPLRFVYATIRINLELERVGDYAESIARQVLKLIGMNVDIPVERFAQLADLSIPMLHDTIHAFVSQNADLASRTMKIEEEVDALRSQLDADLVELRQRDRIPLAALNPLLTIARRYERVSDQAKNICQEVLYMCTGEYSRHKGAEVFRLLFVDRHNSCASQMAEAIANSLGQPQFVFSSAGLEPQPIDPVTAAFMRDKGHDLSRQSPKRLDQIPNLDHYHIVVGLDPIVQKSLPPPPRKTVYLDWHTPDPSDGAQSLEQARAQFESVYQNLHLHISDLVEAILGDAIE